VLLTYAISEVLTNLLSLFLCCAAWKVDTTTPPLDNESQSPFRQIHFWREWDTV